MVGDGSGQKLHLGQYFRRLVMRSSYKKNNLGWELFKQVANLRPKTIIEFGVLDGYSTLWLAMGLKYSWAQGHLTAYDLWDEYPYKHGNIVDVQRMLAVQQVDEFVTLGNMNFWDFLELPIPFDLLHIDISNDGDVIESAIEMLMPHIEDGATVIFEGGSEERDKADWMIEFNRRPIRSIKYPFKLITDKWPSISKVDRKILNASN